MQLLCLQLNILLLRSGFIHNHFVSKLSLQEENGLFTECNIPINEIMNHTRTSVHMLVVSSVLK